MVSNEQLTNMYYILNSACIIDFDALKIETPETTITFDSADNMRTFLITEIERGITI